MSRRIEIGFLLALCVFLPLYEAPKSIAWAGYVVVWLANRARARDFGGKWDLWDTVIALWLVSGFVIAPFAAMHGGEWRAPLDIVRNATVLWMLKRSRLTEREMRAIVGALIASTVIGIIMGLAQLWSGTTGRLELNSVGHVNHTVVYLAIMLGVCASWFFLGRQIPMAGTISLFVLVAIFVAASRSGVVAAVLTLVVLAVFWWPRARFPTAVAAAVVAGAAILAAVGGAEVFEKQAESVQAGHLLNFREEAWKLAVATWQAHPWFGIGMENFGRASRTLPTEQLRNLMPHAHNLYLNTLAERGIVGAAAVFALLALWGWWLLWWRPRREDTDEIWLLWGAATSGWLVTISVGMVNTTFHHEHGLLAVLLLGLWLPVSHRR